MYSVQNNQLLQQLTQLTYGVVATVTNTRVRPRTVHKLSKAPVTQHTQIQTPTPKVVPIVPEESSLGPLLSAEFSRLGLSAFGRANDHEFNTLVSSLAAKVLDKARVGEQQAALQKNLPELWNNVLQTVTEANEGTGWSQKFLQKKKHSLIKQIEREERSASASPYFRFRTGLFDSDKRFLAPSPYLVAQFRGFKTKRDIEAAKERNPSMLNRVKDKFFKEGSPITTGGAATGGEKVSSEKLKSLVGELPPGEADKLKIAFAEGYLSGNGGGGSGEGKSRTYRWLRTLQQILAIAVFTAILASLMGNGSFGGGMFRVNVGNGNEVQPEDINVTFNDVKGVDEAKQELQDIVEFLKNPSRFVALGGKLPKGVLLVGPPGTGKTLLARAVAGEAGVPFFHAAGPEFDEILVGQGARRVRDLFKAAKAKAPCVIFIDEIDSVGAKRTNSVLHPYANQTINQLLSEMDGFRQNEGVIVLGATNRREDLDKALLRPGRFDVEVPVPAPEYQGRKEILEYYLTKVKLGGDVDVELLARGTTGFTGADLENMINQAALKAAIDGASSVGKKHLDFARDKVIMGPSRKNRIPDEETNKITAYHEAGHAIAAYFTKDSNPIHKVTIIPRGPSLGHTAYIPDKEQYHVTKSQLQALMDTMMGGRAAEELIFGQDKITSGASSDLKQATAIATHMVKEWGMSDRVGLRAIDDNSKSLVPINELGPGTTEVVDSEIKRILQESYERAKSILKSHAKEHKALAEALMMYETLDADDVKAILAGQPPQIQQHKKAFSSLTPGPGTGPATPSNPTGGGPIGGKRLNPC